MARKDISGFLTKLGAVKTSYSVYRNKRVLHVLPLEKYFNSKLMPIYALRKKIIRILAKIVKVNTARKPENYLARCQPISAI
jgi:hypothetical protein